MKVDGGMGVLPGGGGTTFRRFLWTYTAPAAGLRTAAAAAA